MKIYRAVTTLLFSALICSYALSNDDIPNDRAIRLMLTAIEFKDERKLLVQYGEKLFPSFERILADRDANSTELTRLFIVLLAVKADRSRFLESAVAKLTDSDKSIRNVAVSLLGDIGSELDTAPIVALLSDEEFTVGVAAAKTLSKIGGARELAALNVWLTVTKPENYSKEWQGSYESLRKNVTKSRDALKERLDKEKAPKPKP